MLKSCLLKKDIRKVEDAVKAHKPVIEKDRIAEEEEEDKKFQHVKEKSTLSPKKDYYRVKDKWYQNGVEVSEEESQKLKKMSIPPGWVNALVSSDPTAKLQAIGQDKVGKWQPRYSAEHKKQKEIEKFNRVKLFSEDMDGIEKNVEKGVRSNDTNAMLLRLELRTAIRMGSEPKFETKKRAYGLTTLKKEHVKVVGDNIVLDFTAKEGIRAHYELKDKTLSKWLKKKIKDVEVGDSLFPETSGNKLNKYLKKMSGNKSYTVKDFRTYRGTELAYKELKKYEMLTLTPKRKKEIIKDVTKKVSSFLHNTSTMAKKSYIDPMVWELIGGM